MVYTTTIPLDIAIMRECGCVEYEDIQDGSKYIIELMIRLQVHHMLCFTGERDRERTLTDNQPAGNTQQYTTFWLLQSCEDVGAECMMMDG